MRGAARRAPGQITIFLSLMLVVLISFVCTALHSARAAGSRYLFTVASEAVTRSVFGAYHTKAWEQYRILMVSEEELALQIAQECAQHYEKNGTLFPLEITSVELTGKKTLAENGAAGWEAEAVSYMENRLSVEAISGLMEQTGLLDEVDGVIQWVKGLRDLLEPIVQLEKKLCQLEKKLSEAVKAFEEGKKLLNSLRQCCETLTAAVNGEADPQEITALWQELNACYDRILHYLGDQEKDAGELAKAAGEEWRASQRLEQQIRDLLTELGTQQGQDIPFLSALEQYRAELQGRYDLLQALPDQLQIQSVLLQQVSALKLPSLQEVLGTGASEQLVEIMACVGEWNIRVWEPERPEMTQGSSQDEKKLSQLLDLKAWLDQGILMLVLEDGVDVSRATLSAELERTERADPDGLLESAYRSLLYGEYALRHTAHYGMDGGNGLQYETEYLITGEESDRANLAGVAGRLLLLRGAMNLLYLIQSGAMENQLQATATGVSAALGGCVPEPLIAVLLAVLWALAEAVCDVRGLLAGKEIPLWKDAGSWQLEWDNIGMLLEDDFTVGGNHSQGMTYQEYLRLLLMTVSSEEKCLRTMELAAENLGKKGAPFAIEKAWYRADVVVTGKAGGQETQMNLTYGY
ncbi:MAG: hypothetical protein IJX71_02195 [Oscillospiraceae bacterium]|nr:hypothetical protein [Oscillospiraceae bacterium]